MATKTDNPEHIGMHCFERAGLGKAPFIVIGYGERLFQAFPGAPVRPGGCCAYCFTGIREAAIIRSADNKIFDVGCDCVRKTGDAGLLKSFKTNKEVREFARQKRKALDARKTAEWEAIMADEAKCEKLSSFTVKNQYTGKEEPWLTMALRAWGYCGASGRARYLKAAKEILAHNT